METSEKFFQRTYQLMRQSRLSVTSEGSFHEVSLIFSEMREPVYLDFCHLGEVGNEIIATKMAHDILKIITSNKVVASKTVSKL
jgi:hypothetical protein